MITVDNVEDNLPLLRIADEIWLKEYIQGHIFLRSHLYFQSLEETDTARADKFDGAVPAINSNVFDSMQCSSNRKVSNIRIMNLNVFVGCLFSFQSSNIRNYQDGRPVLFLSDNNIEEIRGFKSDSVLIIHNKAEFTHRLRLASAHSGIPCKIGTVKYNKCSSEVVSDGLLGEYLGGHKNFETIPFLKDDRFRYQQEFRICCEYKNSIANHTADGIFSLDKNVKNQYRIFDVGSILDISEIVTLEKLISRFS